MKIVYWKRERTYGLLSNDDYERYCNNVILIKDLGKRKLNYEMVLNEGIRLGKKFAKSKDDGEK